MDGDSSEEKKPNGGPESAKIEAPKATEIAKGSLPSLEHVLNDPSLDPDTRKILLQGIIEDNRARREAASKEIEAQATRALESKRFWHNTPLVLALVGTITIFANGAVSFFLAQLATSGTVTVEQLKGQLKASEDRLAGERERDLAKLRNDLSLVASDAEAKRTATRLEREFAFKIVETQLSRNITQEERAEVLLFLARAGIVSSLNVDALKEMAEKSLKNEGPRIPSLGEPVQPLVRSDAVFPPAAAAFVAEVEGRPTVDKALATRVNDQLSKITVPLSENQRAALTAFLVSYGPGVLDKTLSALNAGDYTAVSLLMRKEIDLFPQRYLRLPLAIHERMLERWNQG